MFEVNDDEKILVITREDKFLLVTKLFFWLIVFVLPFLLESILVLYLPNFVNSNAFTIWLLIRDLYLLLCFMGLLMIAAFYYLNVHVVTTKRIVDIDQVGIARHHIVEVDMNKIQHVSSEVKGSWGHLFNYGTVNVESAGEGANIAFENVDNPKAIKRVIMDNYYLVTNERPSDLEP